MLQLKFEPIDKTPEFTNAATEYKDIWNREGAKILLAFEQVTGLVFDLKEIKVIVYEGISREGNLDNPMKLRASYPRDIKLGTLIHELGHRLLVGNGIRDGAGGLDSHQQLDLFLYDVWVGLYGKEFADTNVRTESQRKGFYNYEKAWNWALKMSKEERQRSLNLLKKHSILSELVVN